MDSLLKYRENKRNCENNPILFDMSYMQFKSPVTGPKKNFGVA